MAKPIVSISTALSEARARVQDAESHMHLATHPDVKRQWAEVIDAWQLVLAQLERADHSPAPPLPAGQISN